MPVRLLLQLGHAHSLGSGPPFACLFDNTVRERHHNARNHFVVVKGKQNNQINTQYTSTDTVFTGHSETDNNSPGGCVIDLFELTPGLERVKLCTLERDYHNVECR